MGPGLEAEERELDAALAFRAGAFAFNPGFVADFGAGLAADCGPDFAVVDGDLRAFPAAGFAARDAGLAVAFEAALARVFGAALVRFAAAGFAAAFDELFAADATLAAGFLAGRFVAPFDVDAAAFFGVDAAAFFDAALAGRLAVVRVPPDFAGLLGVLAIIVGPR